MSRAHRELYVYYRVAARDLASALRIVEEAHARLRAQHPTLGTRVLRRAAEAIADDVTLMEIYRADVGIDALAVRREVPARGGADRKELQRSEVGGGGGIEPRPAVVAEPCGGELVKRMSNPKLH